jgi:PAS domain S-box-containing protein
MQDVDKTKEELASEVVHLRQRVAELEAAETERKRMEEALKEREANFKALAENAADGIAIVTPEGTHLYVNRKAAAIAGYSVDELLQMKVSELLSPDEYRRLMKMFSTRLAGKSQPSKYETTFIRKDGGQIPLEISVALTTWHGKPADIVFSRDITERKRAEEALQESEKRYKNIFETIPVSIIVLDKDGQMVDINPYHLTQIAKGQTPKGDFIGKNIVTHPTIVKSGLSETYKRVLEGEPFDRKEVYFPLLTAGADGYFNVRGVPLLKGDEVIGAVIIHEDITERKRMEDLVRTQRDLTLALNIARDLDEGLRICLETALNFSEMDCGGIYFVDEATGGLDLVFHKGLSPDFVKGASHYDADSPNTQLVMAGKPIYTEYLKLKVPLNAVKKHEGLRATAVLPMRHKDWVIGYLNLASHTLYEVPHFSRVALEAIAAQIGSSIARLRAEEALRHSEERFRRVVETMKVGLGAIDENGVYTYVNEYFSMMLGYSIDEMIGCSTRDFYYDEESYKAQEEIFAKRRAGMRDSTPYEVTRRRKDGQKVYAILSPTPSFDADGRFTGSFAIHTDITERKRMEQELRESEERHRTLFEHAGFAISLFDAETAKRVAFNTMAHENLGYTYEEFQEIATANLTISKNPEKPIQHFKRIIEQGSDLYEIQLVAKNGTIRDALISAVPIRMHGKDFIQMIRVDITDQKRAEQSLRESEEKYRSLVESSEDSIYLVDSDYNYLFMNSKYLSRLGLQNSQILGKAYSEFHPPEETKDFAQRVNKVLLTGNALSYEYRSQRDKRYFIRTLSPVKSSESGKTFAITVISKDITDLKQAEETLREREAFNFALFQYNPVETIVVDRDGRITRFNLAKKNSGGRLPTVGDLMYKDYAGKHEIDMSAELMQCIRSGKIKEFPERRYGDIYLSITIAPFSQGALIISEDITERKRTEEALRESERFSSSLLNESPHPIIVINPDTSIRYVNPAMVNLTGFSAEELIGRKVPYPWWAKGTARRTTRALKEALHKGLHSLERNFQKKSGEQFWVEITAVPAVRDGEVQYMLASWIDITERKQAEELLQKERDTFYSILQKAPYGVMLIDKDENLPFVNPEFTNITGYTFEDVPTAKDWFRQAYPDPHYRNMVSETWGKDFIQGEAHETFREKFKRVFSRAFNVVCKNGATKEIEFSRAELGDGRSIVMLADITERKRMHALLETAAAEWRTTFDAISDSVCLLDQKGKIVRCNNAMLQLIGKPFSEIINHHCWEVVHGVLEAPPGSPIKRVAKTHQRETDFFAKNSRWFNVSVDPLLDENGALVGEVHIMSDITERKRVEDELQGSREQLRNLTLYLESVREQERTNIAREIHDELAQALTALKMDVSWLDHRLPSDPKSLIEKTQSMNDLIDTTIQTVKRISAELRPGILDDLGLVAAIEWQAEEFQNRTGIVCHVTVEPQDIMLDQDRSTAIFRIFQETLTNVARHAHATRVTVSLKVKAGTLILRLSDNGRGIAEEQISDPQSFGLIGMQERVHPWGGKVSFKGIPGKGTTVVVNVRIGEDKK